jgi:hypothetical protein
MRPDVDSSPDPPHEGTAAHGREFVYWLAKACCELREAADVSYETIAHYSGETALTVKRFESVETLPRNLDPLIAAYGFVAGFEDNREVYLDAWDLWIEKGRPHTLQGAGAREIDGASRAVAAVTDARRRTAARERRRARRGLDAAPTPKAKRRRAAG